MGEEREEEKRIIRVGSPSRSGSPRTQPVTPAPAPGGRPLGTMLTIRLGVDLHDVPRAHGPHPRQPPATGLSGFLAFNMLSPPAAAPRPYKALCLEKGNFTWDMENNNNTQVLLAPLSPWDSWPGGLRGAAWHEGGLPLPLRPPSGSAHVAAGSAFRWRLGTRLRMEL